MDGTAIFVADSATNVAGYGRQNGSHGGSGYPMLRLVAVVCCGTRAVIDAVVGPYRTGELLADRNFAVTDLISQIAGTGAQKLLRCKENRPLPPIDRLADGSWLAMLGKLRMRVIDADIVVRRHGRGKQHTGRYRLITTLTDHRAFPRARPGRPVPPALADRDRLPGTEIHHPAPTGVDQEVYTLLCAYQALRLAMSDATTTHPATNPDRASFTVALDTAGCGNMGHELRWPGVHRHRSAGWLGPGRGGLRGRGR